MSERINEGGQADPLSKARQPDQPDQAGRSVSDERAYLAVLLEQERDIQFDSFGYDDVWAVGTHLVQLAAERALPIAIAIMLGEQRAFHAGLAGASADNDDWLERKFRVVRRYGHSSLAVGTQFRSNAKDFDTDSRLSVGEYAAHGGAFPLRVRGSLVGTVGVSGLAQREDHALVVEALIAHRDRNVDR